MPKIKKAFITGITGQDGSYLAEFLLEKGYEVAGFVRSSSTGHLGNVEHLKSEVRFFRGSLDDERSIEAAISEFGPDEIYNLGAEAAPADSFKRKVYTSDINALGPLRVFEAALRLQKSGHPVKIYQASTSEMYGAPKQIPQDEDTPFVPNNPYGVAKLFAHHNGRILRDGAEKMFICCGILFNHECLTSQTPLMIKSKNGLIDIIAIEELVPHREDPLKGTKYTTTTIEGIQVWDGSRWAKIKTMTATWNNTKTENDKEVFTLVSRGGYYEATADHISFLQGGKEIKTSEVKAGDKLELKQLPDETEKIVLTLEEAEFLGMMVADGYINADGHARLVNSDSGIRERIKAIWEKISGGTARDDQHPSDFNLTKMIPSVELTGNRSYLRYIHAQIYNEKLFKRVPNRIINADKETMLAFLRGYNLCDGLKSGRQKTEFKSFTTNSPVLAQGLWYLVDKALGLRVTIHPEKREEKIYFHLNINSDNKTLKGKHLAKDINGVKKVERLNYDGWLFDLETDSGTFSAGIGLTWVHNSPRRGMQYVTRKVSVGVACIVNKVRNAPLNEAGVSIVTKDWKLEMGSLDPKRDWGYAKEYVRAMWLMLQQDKPDNFVIATGETHSIEELLETAFSHVSLNWKDHVTVNPAFVRPLETGPLWGNPAKAKKVLGWEPKIKFKELVKMMVDSDLAKFS